MPRTRPRAESLTRRPDGGAAGAAGLVLAWLGGVLVLLLTGATPVLIVLAGLLVLALFAACEPLFVLRRLDALRLTVGPCSTAGEPVPVAVDVAPSAGVRPGGLHVSVRHAGREVGGWWLGAGPAELTFPHRGHVADVDVRVRTAGALGLVWWRASTTVPVDHLVAPPANTGDVPVDASVAAGSGELGGALGAVAGETDGVRPWREGDSERAVHWATSLRAGELVVHDRRRPADRVTVVRARRGAADPDAEAGAARAALERALRAGDEVWAAVADEPPERIHDHAEATTWSARAALGPAAPGEPTRRVWRRPEPDLTAPAAARWWAAAATAIAVTMLCGSLGYGPAVLVPAVAGIAAGALVTGRVVATSAPLPGWSRLLAAVGALAGLVGVISSIGPLRSVFGVIRGPLPQLLIVLIVLHGFESRDRRTLRVGLGISAVVLMYASGFRVDATLGWWLLAWGVTAVATLRRLSGPTIAAGTTSPRRPGRALVAATAVVAGTVAVLSVVPVPRGPARLTMPSLLAADVPVGTPGAIVGPGGDTRGDGDTGGTERSRSPRAGDYTGFAEALDTNVRGDLGDRIVMRVRAAAPDFWRGQTFARFDGRIWYADDTPGVLRRGPGIGVAPAFGDVTRRTDREVESDEFVQTFYMEVDMPNVVFHAYRATEVAVDADVFVRPDGALRATTTFPAGSIYTVVSERRQVTAEALRASGDVARRLTPLGRRAFAPYLEVPESTTARTVELATELAAGRRTTYDVVRAFEEWIAAHVEYDLYAPLPPVGGDAVDDLLFGSRRGFCEQIASALVIMLRTQGVPARLATGYVPGTRDRIAGVWEVRASDAHAWAEVWFPEIGWQAFDPTAEVPLAGDSEAPTVGAQLAVGAARWAEANPALAGAALGGPLAVVGVWRVVGELRRRRRRGRWGLLQDRFTALATRHGAPAGASNVDRAARWGHPDAAEIARRLDASAFDPTWHDDDQLYAETRKLVGELARTHR